MTESSHDVAPLMTVREVCDVLKASRKKVYALINSGALDSVMILGSRRIKPASVESLYRHGTE